MADPNADGGYFLEGNRKYGYVLVGGGSSMISEGKKFG